MLLDYFYREMREFESAYFIRLNYSPVAFYWGGDCDF